MAEMYDDKPDTPHAPAHGYAVMERLLGPDYFIRPLPPEKDSMNLLVIGGDGIPTLWRISRHIAHLLWMRLAGLRDHFQLARWVDHDFNPFPSEAK